MKGSNLTSLLLLSLSACCYAKTVMVFDEKMQSCVSQEEKAGKFDLSELEIVATDDTHSFMNGTWKFTGDVSAPWSYRMYTERYERGKWNLFALDKKIKDFCAVVHRPTEAWYNIFRKVRGCPMKAGDVWAFDMVPLAIPIIFPKSYEGRWRLVQEGNFAVDGNMKKECTIINFDVVDV